MIGKWKTLNSRSGLNRISLEIQSTKEQLEKYAGHRHWVNAADKNDLKYFLREKLIDNLEYLEGIILLNELQ